MLQNVTEGIICLMNEGSRSLHFMASSCPHELHVIIDMLLDNFLTVTTSEVPHYSDKDLEWFFTLASNCSIDSTTGFPGNCIKHHLEHVLISRRHDEQDLELNPLKLSNSHVCHLVYVYAVILEILGLLIFAHLIFIVIYYLWFQEDIKISCCKIVGNKFSSVLSFEVSFNCELLTTLKILRITLCACMLCWRLHGQVYFKFVLTFICRSGVFFLSS